MRELHLVAVSEDGRHVLLADKSGATDGGFRVALDGRLAAAVRGDLPRVGAEPAGPELTPKDIQARLRSGESAEAIALSAGVPVTRVERFAGPVQAEMARMIDEARSSCLVRGRLGRSAVPLGAAVDGALARTPSLGPDSVEWQTRREEHGSWLVTVGWSAGTRTRTASWRYDPANKVLTAVDPASAALGRLDPDAPVSTPKRRSAIPKARATKATENRAPVADGVVAAPVEQAPPAQPSQASALRVVPSPDPGLTRKSTGERSGVKTRATVPGWADVLLGTSPGSER